MFTDRLKLMDWMRSEEEEMERILDRCWLPTLRGHSKWLAVSRELEHPIWAAGTLSLRKV
jgi:hypothetical protein